MSKGPRTRITFIFLLLALHLFLFCSSDFAHADEDSTVLLMYFRNEDLLVEAPTRSAKPLSRVAENVTVVTARDIERMNAHTVAEVLNTVSGVQVSITSGPGSPASAIYVQGSDPRHVTVLIDGVSLNNLSDNVADLGSIPVQNIEKIEIVKGPASSAWGSALGGVVNIVTKSGRLADGAGGLVSASSGERNMGDFRAEARGKQETLGYYLNAGRLQSDGLTPHYNVSNNNAYAKLTYALTDDTNLGLTANFIDVSRDIGEFQEIDFSISDELQHLRSALSLQTALTNNMDLRFSLWSVRQSHDLNSSRSSTGELLSLDNFKDQGIGSNAELIYKSQIHNLVFGVDLDSKTLTSNRIAGEEQALRKAAVYLNDTLSLDKLSITPGIRFDYTSSNGNITSPSLGLTYKISETTIIRGYTAQGFGVPPLVYTFGDNQRFTGNPELDMERVLSYQAGAETAAIKYFWAKLSMFRHEIREAILIESHFPSPSQAVNEARQRRQGVEAEMKTAAVLNTSLTAGAVLVVIKDLNTGLTVENIPRKTYDVGLIYDDEKSFRAQLKGRYIDWNMSPLAQGSYGNIIFDLNAAYVISRSDEDPLEAFATGHNIFNGSQYPILTYKNPDRWVEAGLRYKF